jgi:hypothetical protein
MDARGSKQYDDQHEKYKAIPGESVDAVAKSTRVGG